MIKISPFWKKVGITHLFYFGYSVTLLALALLPEQIWRICLALVLILGYHYSMIYFLYLGSKGEEKRRRRKK
jgi:hypothetical protein